MGGREAIQGSGRVWIFVEMRGGWDGAEMNVRLVEVRSQVCSRGWFQVQEACKGRLVRYRYAGEGSFRYNKLAKEDW